MPYMRFHLPVLLPSCSIISNIVNCNCIRLYSICALFYFQILVSSSSLSSKYKDHAVNLTESIDEYLCQNYVMTCYFRRRHHASFDNQLPSDNCKPLLILHSCLHHDTDTIRICRQSSLNLVKINLGKETPKHCFTSSMYKKFYAQHLRSISPARTTVKCQISMLLFLLISFVIRIRVCC